MPQLHPANMRFSTTVQVSGGLQRRPAVVPLKREAYWLKMTGMSSADAARGTGKLDGKLNRCQVQRLYRSRQVEFRKRGLRLAVKR